MQLEGSLPCSQQSNAFLYPKRDQWNPYPKASSWTFSSHLCLCLPCGPFPSDLHTKPCIHLSPLRAKCPTHYILLGLITIRFLVMTLSPASRQLLPSRPQVSHSTTFSNTLSLFSSLNAQNQASRPHEDLKLTFLGVLTAIFSLNKNNK